jgi:hypothetical protein
MPQDSRFGTNGFLAEEYGELIAGKGLKPYTSEFVFVTILLSDLEFFSK